MPKRETYIKFFRHFAFRLAGRYGILITFEEYCVLCSLPLIDAKVKKQTDRRPVIDGVIHVQGQDVIVRKDYKNHKLLLTVLLKPKKKKIKVEINECENV